MSSRTQPTMFRRGLNRGIRPRLGYRDDTTHLFSSPANARRLLSALQKSLAGEGKPFTVEALRAELGLDEE